MDPNQTSSLKHPDDQSADSEWEYEELERSEKETSPASLQSNRADLQQSPPPPTIDEYLDEIKAKIQDLSLAQANGGTNDLEGKLGEPSELRKGLLDLLDSNESQKLKILNLLGMLEGVPDTVAELKSKIEKLEAASSLKDILIFEMTRFFQKLQDGSRALDEKLSKIDSTQSNELKESQEAEGLEPQARDNSGLANPAQETVRVASASQDTLGLGAASSSTSTLSSEAYELKIRQLEQEQEEEIQSMTEALDEATKMLETTPESRLDDLQQTLIMRDEELSGLRDTNQELSTMLQNCLEAADRKPVPQRVDVKSFDEEHAQMLADSPFWIPKLKAFEDPQLMALDRANCEATVKAQAEARAEAQCPGMQLTQMSEEFTFAVNKLVNELITLKNNPGAFYSDARIGSIEERIVRIYCMSMVPKTEGSGSEPQDTVGSDSTSPAQETGSLDSASQAAVGLEPQSTVDSEPLAEPSVGLVSSTLTSEAYELKNRQMKQDHQEVMQSMSEALDAAKQILEISPVLQSRLDDLQKTLTMKHHEISVLRDANQDLSTMIQNCLDDGDRKVQNIDEKMMANTPFNIPKLMVSGNPMVLAHNRADCEAKIKDQAEGRAEARYPGRQLGQMSEEQTVMVNHCVNQLLNYKNDPSAFCSNDRIARIEEQLVGIYCMAFEED